MLGSRQESVIQTFGLGGDGAVLVEIYNAYEMQDGSVQNCLSVLVVSPSGIRVADVMLLTMLC